MGRLRDQERLEYSRALAIATGLILAAGCAVAPSAPLATVAPETAARPSPSPEARPPLGSPAAKVPARGTDSGGSEAIVAAAVTDAAGRSGVPATAVRVVRVEPRDWPDSSLGCPRPGMGYAQVITPGYLILLEVAGQTLEYHADRNRIELCTT
jgi:hypothetical protein